MKNRPRTNRGLSSRHDRRVLANLVAVFMVASLGAGAVWAQTPEVAGSAEYRAEKTVADYTNAAQNAASGDFDYAENNLRVEVWVDKADGDIYRKGEALSVGLETNQDAYAVVYRIDTEGVVTVLWPRSRLDDGFLFGGHEYTLPVSGARQLRVSTQEGEGIVEAVVSRYPFDLRALELDFHHEHKAERYDFRVAGDPYLAMNEVNYAVTGLEDSGEYVVTNYAGYYVHQQVDHPRYLCSQCHIDDEVAYDPYRDSCKLDIERDYSWYNNWYDSYGYYPVYGNPVYVYIDPWTWNPWVNYWYRPAYTCAPWYGWGWGWGDCYSWNYSPYFRGDCVTVYNGGYSRYRPLDRTRLSDPAGPVTKTREYSRGSAMVRRGSLSDSDRSTMVTRVKRDRTDRREASVVGRGGGRDISYRGAEMKSRSRTDFVQVATGGRSQSGLRIRDTGRGEGAARSRTPGVVSGKRHTSAGVGQRGSLRPVSRGSSLSDENWRGTTRVGGTGTTVGTSRRSTGNSGGTSAVAPTGRSRSSAGSKTVQPRKRSTRVWNATGGRTESTNKPSRTRSGTVNSRQRSSSGGNEGSSVRRTKPSTSSKATGNRTPTRVKKSSGSEKSSGSSRSSGGSRTSKSGSSSRESKSNTRGGNSRSGGSRR